MKQPKEKCEDPTCPFHGNLKVHGRVFVGTVISAKMRKSVTVQWERRQFLPKYERFERRRSKIHAHNPLCLNAEAGDTVKIMECRPLSKTKNFVVIEILKGEQK